MNGLGGILRPEDFREIQSYEDDTSGDFEGMLDCIGRIIAMGVSEGRFTERQAHHDLDVALLIAYACNNIGDYEHFRTSLQWLSDVEDLARGSGVWFYRYANALMYCGRPRLAMEYLLRGTDEEPSYPWNWLTLGRLYCHYGDRDKALSAAKRGLGLLPADPDFTALMEDIEAGRTIEEMESRQPGEDSPDPAAIEAAKGIMVDPRGLRDVKDALRPAGWIADHPYCTYVMDFPRGSVFVTLMMNEAYLSKIPAQDIRRIIDAIPDMEDAARAALGKRVEGRPLYAVNIDRGLRSFLSFAGYGGQEPVVASFDEGMSLDVPRDRGGPFIAMVLLEEDAWDPDRIQFDLVSQWGIRCRIGTDGNNLTFECDGDLAIISKTSGPVPDGEAEANAVNNYRWPDARDRVRHHRAHILVALVNHSSDCIAAATLHTKIVSAVCSQPGVIGVYIPGAVISADDYIREAESIRDGALPIGNWVWVGLSHRDGEIRSYTCGLHLFGKLEVETVGCRDSADTLLTFMNELLYHILAADEKLSDGDIVQHPDGRMLRVEVSEGITTDGDTVKILFPPRIDRCPSHLI